MLAELTLGVNGLKAATDLVKALRAGATEVQLNEVKIALQGHILEAHDALFAAQAAQASAADRIRDLEQEIVKLKDWEAKKLRYELKAIDVGAFAYMRQPGMEDGEPPHWLCAHCFENRHRSILQFKESAGRQPMHAYQDRWECRTCGGCVVVRNRTSPLGQTPP